MKISESICIPNAKYLLSLPDDKLKGLIRVDYQENGEKSIWNPDTYFKRMKIWLNLMVKFYNGTHNPEYKYSKSLVNYGRLYVDKFGVQSLQRHFRAFLTNDLYNDYDMVNCHPTILLYLTKKYFPKTDLQYLKLYVNKRNEFLKQYKINKIDVLVSINSKKSFNTKNVVLAKLDREFKTIQNLFFDNTPKDLKKYEVHKHNNKNNPKGGFLNTLLTIIENDILQGVISHFESHEISTIMFDGLFIIKELNINNTLKKLNDLTFKKFGIKWSHKIPEDIIQIDEGIIINEDEFNKDYKTIKPIFEKTNFIIQNPFSYGNEWEHNGEKRFNLKNKGDFKDLNNHFMCENVVKGQIQEVEFFNLWLKDNDKRTYKKIDFIPKNNIDKNIYNTFSGFNFEEFNDDIETIDIQPFINHIGVLVNNEQESIDYLLNYLAHLIQKPYERPRIALLFKSKQGYGKDLFINFIEKMLGSQYIGRVSDLNNELFGQFNPILKNNLVLQLNELEGKHGFENKEKLKVLITAEEVSINDKNDKKYQQSNYSRVIICSNNLTPIQITDDDRRYVVFQAQDKKPNSNYFNNLVSYLNNDTFIYSLYKYLKFRDISNISLTNDRPMTSAYNNMKDGQTNNFYEYLNLFTDNYNDVKKRYNNILFNNSTNTMLIPPSTLIKDYKRYLNNNFYDTNIKNTFINAMMLELNVNKIEKKMDNTRIRFYQININSLIEKMKSKNIYVEIDDFDLEGFE